MSLKQNDEFNEAVAEGTIMFIHDFTVKICHQTLNTTKTAKEIPYFYNAEEPDFKALTTDQLNHLYLEAQEIEARLQTMLAQRG